MLSLSTEDWHDIKEFARKNSYTEALEKLNKVSEFDKHNFKIIVLGCCQKGMQENVKEKFKSNHLKKIDAELLEYLRKEYPEYSGMFQKTQADIKYV